MPTQTYVALANITLGSTAASVTFGSIPSTYRDLILVVQHRVATAETDVQFNADTGNNYQTVTMRGGADSNIYSANFTANGIKPQNSVGGASGSDDNFQLNIMDYATTDKQKISLLKSGNGAASFVQNHAVRWANTAAITSVKCTASGGTYSAGSTFAIYGVIA